MRVSCRSYPSVKSIVELDMLLGMLYQLGCWLYAISEKFQKTFESLIRLPHQNLTLLTCGWYSLDDVEFLNLFAGHKWFLCKARSMCMNIRLDRIASSTMKRALNYASYDAIVQGRDSWMRFAARQLYRIHCFSPRLPLWIWRNYRWTSRIRL